MHGTITAPHSVVPPLNTFAPLKRTSRVMADQLPACPLSFK